MHGTSGSHANYSLSIHQNWNSDEWRYAPPSIFEVGEIYESGSMSRFISWDMILVVSFIQAPKLANVPHATNAGIENVLAIFPTTLFRIHFDGGAVRHARN